LPFKRVERYNTAAWYPYLRTLTGYDALPCH